MKQRALDLGVLLGGQLAALGPSARSVSVRRPSASWLFIRIGVATDAALRDLAEDLGLDQARTVRHGRIWFREAEARADGLIVIAAGPVREGEEPEVGP